MPYRTMVSLKFEIYSFFYVNLLSTSKLHSKCTCFRFSQKFSGSSDIRFLHLFVSDINFHSFWLAHIYVYSYFLFLFFVLFDFYPTCFDKFIYFFKINST